MTPTRVLLDAVNVRAAGPSALVRALVPALHNEPSLICTGLIPEGRLEEIAWPHGVQVVRARTAGWRNRALRVSDIIWRVEHTARASNADVVFSLGDIGPLFSARPSVLFLHNALLVGGARGGTMALSRLLFCRSAQRASRILVQSPIMAAALQGACSTPQSRIEVVPHPPPSTTRHGVVASAVLDDTKPCRLLYLAAYYEHKRHDLLPDIVSRLRAMGIADRVTIYVTIKPSDGAAPLLRQLEACQDVVSNLGSLSADDAAATLAMCEGLLHLSEAESYGMTLIEALIAGREIIAPDLEYARWLCGDAAQYFSASNASEAAEAIGILLASSGSTRHADARRRALNKFLPTWAASAAQIAKVLVHAAKQTR